MKAEPPKSTLSLVDHILINLAEDVRVIRTIRATADHQRADYWLLCRHARRTFRNLYRTLTVPQRRRARQAFRGYLANTYDTHFAGPVHRAARFS